MSATGVEHWINRRVDFFLRHWVATASTVATLIVAGAVLIPILAANGFDTLSWLGYSAYRILCPQRPDHSWFIMGEKMGFEQRDTAMFVAGAVAGPLWIVAKRFGFRSLDGRTVILLQIPILIDVFSQMVGLRDSDGFWRSLTGTISVFAVAGWLYPRIDEDFHKAREKIASTQGATTPEAESLDSPAEPVQAD